MSVVSVDLVFSQSRDYLKGLIKTVISEDKELLKNSIIELLEEDQEFKDYVSGMILTDQDIPKRVGRLEEVTGHAEKYYLEEKEVTIPERITKLEEKIESLKVKPIPDNQPVTITEIRVDYLVEFAQTDEALPEVTVGDEVHVSVDRRGFRRFVKTLPDELQPKSMKNLRKLKKDLFELAESRYKGVVWKDQSKNGNRELRLVMVRKALLSVTE